MTEQLKIGVCGVGGRMGRTIVQTAHANPGCVVAAALERPGHALVGQDCGDLAGVGSLGVAVGDDPAAFYAAIDAAIDFSVPDATSAAALAAAEAGVAFVAGTTGLDAAQQQTMSDAAARIPVVWAPNMSVGVNVMFALTQLAAAALDDAYDIEIVEMHHRHKIDAPSGTALGFGRAAAAGRGVDLADVQVLSREGHTGARDKGAIGFATLRGGEVVGDHTVVFAGPGERIELTHRAATRQNFAEGALRAALWARAQPPGLYGMADVLGLQAV